MITVNKGCLQKLKAQTLYKVPRGIKIKIKSAKEQESVNRFLKKEDESINRRFRPNTVLYLT